MLIFPTLLFVKCWQFQLNMYSSFFGVRLKQWLNTICLLIMFILMANKVHKQFWSVVFEELLNYRIIIKIAEYTGQ